MSAFDEAWFVVKDSARWSPGFNCELCGFKTDNQEEFARHHCAPDLTEYLQYRDRLVGGR